MLEEKTTLISLITVISSCFEYFEETFLSIKKQTLPDWELVLVCSEKNSQLVRDFVTNNACDELSKIKLVVKSSVDNYSSAINAGMRKSKGQFILILDQFDTLSFNFIEEVRKHAANSNDKLFYADALIQYETNFLSRPFKLGYKKHPLNQTLLSTVDMIIRQSPCLLPFIFPKKITDEIGFLKEKNCEFPRWDYLVRLKCKLCLYKIPKIEYIKKFKNGVYNPNTLIDAKISINNFRYLLLHDFITPPDSHHECRTKFDFFDYSKLIENEERCQILLNKKSYNSFLNSIAIKSYKLLLLVFRRCVNKVR